MSVHFTLAEFVRSRVATEHGIDNAVPEKLMTNLEFTMAGCERIRAYLGHAMTITSGYRCPELNHEVGGAENSQHLSAQAADFICPGFGPPRLIVKALKPMRFVLGIDQLILEKTWVHVSFTAQPRYQVLEATESRFVEL